MPTSDKKPLTITRLELSNVKRINAVSISPNGNMVVIGGDNAQGKTSVLDAIQMTLAGTKCPQPIRKGAKSGKSTVDLGDIIVTRTFTEAGGSLTVKNKEGAVFPSPQAMLDKLIGPISFDPLAFTKQKPREQLETLRTLVGVDTSELDRQYADRYEERTDLNRQVKAVETLIQSKLTAIGDRPEPTEETDTAKLLESLKTAQAMNRDVDIAEQKAKDAKLRLGWTKEELSSAESRLEAAKLALENSQKDVDAQTRFLARDTHLAAEATEAAEDAQATRVNESVIRQRIAEAGDAKELQKMHKDLRTTQQTLSKLQADATACTKNLDGITASKREMIQGAAYPVPGLELGEDGILFAGIPFQQASAAEQLRVSMAMALAMNPRLSVCLIRDGSLLDQKSLALVAEMAAAADAQVWLERVGDGRECSVIIEDGAVAENRMELALAAA